MQSKQFQIPDGPFAPTWDSLKNYQTPNWYQDGKFGIFIHWGAYCVPAFGNEWYPRNMYIEGTPEFEHHRKTYGPQDEFGYKDFIPLFRAEKFDPNRWANLFRQAGAKFVVPVAEHHDGFAMYDTKLSEWNAVQKGPKRDIIGELSVAVRKQGLTFGLSSHRAEHWWFLSGGMKFPSDVQDERYIDLYGPAQNEELPPNQEFLENWLERTCELVDKYRPELIFFDWWIHKPVFKSYLQKFAAYYYNRGAEWQRGVVVNYKSGAFEEGTATYDVERGQLSDIRSNFWQADTAVAKNSWSHTEGNEYKTPESILGDLCDVVSKNGAMLLNIGPKADGSIPEEDEAILLHIGKWLWFNGEAIYGTRPWKVFGEGPTEVVEGHFTDTNRSDYTSRDIRFTTKGDVVYAISLGSAGETELTIQSFGTNLKIYPKPIVAVEILVNKPELIGTSAHERVEFQRDEHGLHLRLPKERFVSGPFVFKIIPGT